MIKAIKALVKACEEPREKRGPPRDDCGVKNGVAISLGDWYFPSVRDPAQVCQGHASPCS